MDSRHHWSFKSPTGPSPELSALNSQLDLLEQDAGLEISCGSFQIELPHGHMVSLCFMLTSVAPPSQWHLDIMPDLCMMDLSPSGVVYFLG